MENNTENRIKRIQKMEKIMNNLSRIQAKLNEALDEFESFQSEIKEFDEYYSSKYWIEDYDAANRGEIPENIQMGVLSEDIPYDILGENFYLAKRMKKLVKMYDRK